MFILMILFFVKIYSAINNLIHKYFKMLFNF